MAEPFGTTAPETNPASLGSFTQNLRFPGQYADQESGLSYNWHRYYGPDGGRYTQPDPLGLVGGDVGLYNYVRGQPTRYTDPTGLILPALAIPFIGGGIGLGELGIGVGLGALLVIPGDTARPVA